MSALAPLLALLMLQAAEAPPAEAPPAADEIVVTGRRERECRVRFADRAMSDREFEARAAEWAAGRPVRVILPAGQGHACMVKIMFQLADRGVKLVEYVDRADPAAAVPTARSPAAPATPR